MTTEKWYENKLWESQMEAQFLEDKIAQLTAERDELKLAVAQTKLDISAWKNICTEWYKDAERLAKKHLDLYNSCVHCGHHKYSGMDHAIDCPITLHRELVEKYNITTRTRTNITTRSENAK